jgi:hypothetical protein
MKRLHYKRTTMHNDTTKRILTTSPQLTALNKGPSSSGSCCGSSPFHPAEATSCAHPDSDSDSCPWAPDPGRPCVASPGTAVCGSGCAPSASSDPTAAW